MKKRFMKILTLIVALCLLFTTTISALAGVDEVYLSELRIIYADDYDEACEILEECNLENYQVLDANLNEDTGKTGTWLAYQTTTNIEDAITDIAIMQMDGGYNEGSYQEMLKESLEEYRQMGEIYLEAISYFADAYNSGDFLAEAAYRQLNFYTGVDGFEDQTIGDLFLDNSLTDSNLAVMFLEGNSYVLSNIRSLLAMGVSYNEDGKHYLAKVEDSVEKMNQDPDVFDDDYDELAAVVSGTILTFRDMFKELETLDGQLNYYDDDITETEIEYSEYTSIADRLKEVKYLDGKTLYEFCLEYEYDEDDLSCIYPLVDALNEGQIAMARVAHYYDVVRYSMSEYPEEFIDEQIAENEEIYSEYPFDIYFGVDRSIYDGTFALTSEAYRADAYTESGFSSYLFHEKPFFGVSAIVSGAACVGFAVWGIVRTVAAKKAVASSVVAKELAVKAAKKTLALVEKTTQTTIAAKSSSALGLGSGYGSTYGQVINKLYLKYYPNLDSVHLDLKLDALRYKADKLTQPELDAVKHMQDDYASALKDAKIEAKNGVNQAENMTTYTVSKSAAVGTGLLYVASALMLIYTAISLCYATYCYYHPEYSDIPVALVDLINTPDGDRYIKYDAVLEVEAKSNGTYAPGDLNAFSAQRWNAVYYTKSYEAGKPLLADEFEISYNNNVPEEGYAPIHGFGEIICYDLNRYNFDDDCSIYVSVMQSENNKAAVTDVPELIGSIFSSEYLFLVGGVGALIGVGGTLSMQGIIKKSKKSEELDDASEATE